MFDFGTNLAKDVGMKQPLSPILMPYKGRAMPSSSLVYAPYIPLQFSFAIDNACIKLTHHTVDFNPQIKFTKQFLRYSVSDNRATFFGSTLIKSFTEAAWDWLVESAGTYDVDWAMDLHMKRVWFKSNSTMTAFKLTFDGYKP